MNPLFLWTWLLGKRRPDPSRKTVDCPKCKRIITLPANRTPRLDLTCPRCGYRFTMSNPATGPLRPKGGA